MWLCLCDCGNEAVTGQSNLATGNTTSCGCRLAEIRATIGQRGKRTHMMRNSAEYRAWTSMKQRCFNPNVVAFKNYGARGITVCDEWRNSFEAFLRDVGKKPAPNLDLDRIDNEGNYEPGNCRWVTRSVNVANTRPRKRRADGTFASALL